MMQLSDQVKKIETYICEYFEDWDLDDPVEEGYLEDYQDISGASKEELQAFEERLGIRLPSDFKELYSYKNGSKFFSILPYVIDQRDLTFSLMSLQEIETCKTYFQNRDALLTEFPDYFSSQDLENMHDSRIKPYLFIKNGFLLLSIVTLVILCWILIQTRRVRKVRLFATSMILMKLSM